MKKYIKPDIECRIITPDDVITTSGYGLKTSWNDFVGNDTNQEL